MNLYENRRLRMKRIFGYLTVLIMLLLSAGVYAQDSTSTGTSGTGSGTTGSESQDMQQEQQQSGTTQSQSMQNDDQLFDSNADNWSQSLSDELRLNASQRDSVRSILLDYQKQRASLTQDMSDTQLSQFNSRFNSRIMGILEDDQVNSYNSYNQGWWNEINSSISNTGRNTQDKNQQY